MPMSANIAAPIVFDVNVLVRAIAVGFSPYRCRPSPPPTSTNPDADCVGIINDAAEFALWLSPHVLSNTGRVLVDVVKMPEDEVDAYVCALVDMADASGGGVVDPPQRVDDCPDWEDNRVLDLALETGAFMIVSGDADLAAMSPWRGRPIIEPAQFTSLVDASRRARKRRRR